MVTILFAVVSIFVFRFRSRAALELKLVALQHQLAVLRRRRPGRPQLSSLDRLHMGVALPHLAAGHRRDGTGQARNRCLYREPHPVRRSLNSAILMMKTAKDRS